MRSSRLPCPAATADKQLADRASTFAEDLFRELASEPEKAKRRIG